MVAQIPMDDIMSMLYDINDSDQICLNFNGFFKQLRVVNAYCN